MKDHKEEQKQLDLLSKQIKEKKAEIEVFNTEMKVKQASLDAERQEVKKLLSDNYELNKQIDEKQEDLNEKQKDIDEGLEGIKMKRAAIDRLAQASDRRLSLAKKVEDKNKVTLKEIEEKGSVIDQDTEKLRKNLEGKHITADRLKQARIAEFEKSKVQLEALQKEREDIRDNKLKHERMIKEVTETKAQLNAQLNQNKTLEQSLKKVQGDLKAREIACDNREKILKDDEVEIRARWAKINRQKEVEGFKQELAQIDEGR